MTGFANAELTVKKVGQYIQLSEEQIQQWDEDRRAIEEARARWEAMTPAERAQATAEREGDRQSGQTVSGEAKPVAAWLRAVADQLDPKHPMRGGNTVIVEHPTPRIIPVPIEGPMRS